MESLEQTGREEASAVSEISYLLSSTKAARKPEMRAGGLPNEIIFQCPEFRPLSYTTAWYRFSAEPDFLVCSRCYKSYIEATEFAESFTCFRSKSGVPSLCRFWVPRLTSILWPEAISSHDLTKVAGYMERRVQIADCKGPIRIAVSDDTTQWYYRSDEKPDYILCCPACYEDRIAETKFADKFVPDKEVQEQRQMQSCDLCLPLVDRGLKAHTEMDDWNGFKNLVKRRLQLPVCVPVEGGELVGLRDQSWFTTHCYGKALWICETCYLDRIAFTAFEEHFDLVPQNTLNSMVGERLTCMMSVGSIMVAIESARMRNDYSIFLNSANVVMSSKRCSTEGIVDGLWYVLEDDSEDFQICQGCYAGIIATCEMGLFFNIATRERESRHTCALNPASPRFSSYVEKLAQAVDVGDFSIFSSFVRKACRIPTCPRMDRRVGIVWYDSDDCSICQDCYETTVSDTCLAGQFKLRGRCDTGSKICCLYSPRTRRHWAEACEKGSIDGFLAYSRYRLQVFAETMVTVEKIKRGKLARMKGAMAQGTLSVGYFAQEHHALQTGTGDRYLHGNNEVGWYQTWYGAESALRFDLMEQGMADANRGDEWWLIAQLEARWKEVE